MFQWHALIDGIMRRLWVLAFLGSVASAQITIPLCTATVAGLCTLQSGGNTLSSGDDVFDGTTLTVPKLTLTSGGPLAVTPVTPVTVPATANMVPGGQVTVTVSVTGATDQMRFEANPPKDPGSAFDWKVFAVSGVITLRIWNLSPANASLPGGTWTVVQ